MHTMYSNVNILTYFEYNSIFSPLRAPLRDRNSSDNKRVQTKEMENIARKPQNIISPLGK